MAGPERQIPEEIAYLVERGGLTQAHWEEVVKRARKSKFEPPYYFPSDRVDQTFIKYGVAVIEGRLPDTGDVHKEYLGRRHWSYIGGLSTEDRVVDRRIFGIFPVYKFVSNRVADQARAYAEFEKENSYTLDDYFYLRLGSLYEESEDIQYDVFGRSFNTGWKIDRDLQGRWRFTERRIVSGNYYGPEQQEMPEYGYQYKTTLGPNSMIDHYIRKHLGVSDEELPNPSGMTIEEMIEDFKKKGIVRELMRRFNTLSGWEKEIPQKIKSQ